MLHSVRLHTGNGNYGCTSEISLCEDDLQNSKQITLLTERFGADRYEKNNTAFIAVNCNNKHLLHTVTGSLLVG